MTWSAATPRSLTARPRATAEAVLSVMIPVITGTRPRTSSLTTAVIRRTSSVVRA